MGASDRNIDANIIGTVLPPNAATESGDAARSSSQVALLTTQAALLSDAVQRSLSDILTELRVLSFVVNEGLNTKVDLATLRIDLAYDSSIIQ
jgi:hypothetical protein